MTEIILPDNIQEQLNKQLWDAAYEGDIDAVKQALEQGADVNARAKLGNTPLHDAACYGRTEIAKMLIDKGADVNARDKDGKTPLHRAAWYGHTEIAKMLKQHGGRLMTTITLPDHISFEELANKWCSCDIEYSSTAIIYYKGIWQLVNFYSKQDGAFYDNIFMVDMKTRELQEVPGEPELAKTILDYIKEKSNGQN